MPLRGNASATMEVGHKRLVSERKSKCRGQLVPFSSHYLSYLMVRAQKDRRKIGKVQIRCNDSCSSQNGPS